MGAHSPLPWTARFHETNQRTRTGHWYFVSRLGETDQRNVRLSGCTQRDSQDAAFIEVAVNAHAEQAAEVARLRDINAHLQFREGGLRQELEQAREQRDGLARALAQLQRAVHDLPEIDHRLIDPDHPLGQADEATTVALEDAEQPPSPDELTKAERAARLALDNIKVADNKGEPTT